MYCSKCGTQIPDDSYLCSSCGAWIGNTKLTPCSICGSGAWVTKITDEKTICIDCLTDEAGVTEYIPLQGLAETFRKSYAEERANRIAAGVIANAMSRTIQVECKVCAKKVSELAAVCPDCGESLPGLRIQCPKCRSLHLTVGKKGFSVGQATAGAIAVGTTGLIAGMIGSKDSRLVCLGCNYEWNLRKPKAASADNQSPLGRLIWNLPKPKAPVIQAGIASSQPTAGEWRGKGLALNGLGRYKEAIPYFDMAVGIDAKLTDAWIGKGCAFIGLKRYEEAITCFDKVLEIGPRYALAWHWKGFALSKLERHQEAIECLEKVLEINPIGQSGEQIKALSRSEMKEVKDKIKQRE
jgi:hypothetical protein